jgi:hypothetical protein
LERDALQHSRTWFPQNPDKVVKAWHVQVNVKQVLQDYDFILISERMDESLVAMTMVMGIPVEDVLVSPSNVAASNYYYHTQNGTE